jgi:hypothetical protein
MAARLVPGIAAWYNADFLVIVSGLVAGAIDITGRGSGATQSTSGNRLTWFPSDALFGGRAAFGSTTNAGYRHILTPSLAAKNVIFSAYYGTGATSIFATYDCLLMATDRSSLLVGDRATNIYYSDFAYDASPSKNGGLTSATILPLPASTLTHTGNATKAWLIGSDTEAGIDRTWKGAIRNVVIASTSLSAYWKRLVEGVIAWDGNHQHRLVETHPFRYQPPRVP